MKHATKAREMTVKTSGTVGMRTALVATALALGGCGSDDSAPAGSSATGGSGAEAGPGGASGGPNGGAAGVGGSATGGTAGSTGEPAKPLEPGWPGDVPLLDGVDQLCTFLLIGPSDAAGYYAEGLNAQGGGGFARLLYDAGKDAFAGKDLVSRDAGVVFIDQSESGFTTTDMRQKLEASLGSLDAGARGCDTWVHLGNPGNDFNDNPLTVVSASATAAAAATARANYAAMIDALRGVFEDAASDRKLVVSISTVQDPTDGTGDVPAEFIDGFCKIIHNPQFTPALRTQAIANLATLNAEIAAEAAAQGGGVLDQHGAIFGHAMPSGDRWLYQDCTHPNDAGHRAIRRYGWYLLTGEWP